MRRPCTLNHLTAAILVEALMDGPSSVPEIAASTGLSYTTTRRYVAALYRRGLCHVGGWDTDTFGRTTLRAYQLGRGRDVARPVPQSRAERARTYRQRTKVLAPVILRMDA